MLRLFCSISNPTNLTRDICGKDERMHSSKKEWLLVGPSRGPSPWCAKSDITRSWEVQIGKTGDRVIASARVTSHSSLETCIAWLYLDNCGIGQATAIFSLPEVEVRTLPLDEITDRPSLQSPPTVHQ